MRFLSSSLLFRVLGRFCDYCAFYLLIGGIAFSLPYFYTPSFYYVLALLTPLLWIPLEAFCLSHWATTPGKRLFGFWVWGAEGVPLSYRGALKWALCWKRNTGRLVSRPLSWRRMVCGFATSALFMLGALYGNALCLWSAGLERTSLSSWVQYSSEEAGFKIAFPEDPELLSKELPIPNSDKVLNYEEITSQQSRKVAYSVCHIKLPGKWRLASNTTLLKGVLDVLVQYSDGAVLLEKEFKMHGPYRVLDYRVQQGNEETQGRLLIVGSKLYKLTVVYPPAKSAQVQVDPFLDSFEIS